MSRCKNVLPYTVFLPDGFPPGSTTKVILPDVGPVAFPVPIGYSDPDGGRLRPPLYSYCHKSGIF